MLSKIFLTLCSIFTDTLVEMNFENLQFSQQLMQNIKLSVKIAITADN